MNFSISQLLIFNFSEMAYSTITGFGNYFIHILSFKIFVKSCIV